MIGRREVRFQRLRRHVVPVSRKVWLLKLAEKKKKRQRESARGSEQDSIIDRNHAKLCGNEDSAPCDIDHRYSADSDDQSDGYAEKILKAAKDSLQRINTQDNLRSTSSQRVNDHEILKRMDQLEMHVQKIRESQEEILRILKESGGGSALRTHVQQQTPERYTINGRNVMLLSARDGYAFGLKLLQMLFSREELSKSLVYASNKSKKPPLNKEKVERLLELVQERFKNTCTKVLITKLNQKCRDSGRRKN